MRKSSNSSHRISVTLLTEVLERIFSPIASSSASSMSLVESPLAYISMASFFRTSELFFKKADSFERKGLSVSLSWGL